MSDAMNVDYDGLIPNNVGLNADARLRRALESWHPGYLDWWQARGPEGFQESLVYLRTAVSVEPEGWAKFGYVRMPEYRWGILLAPAMADRRIPFGAHHGEPAWQEVPGDYRAMLRRLIVVQGDTEPASVEQQFRLGQTAPSLYDLRNLFQVNVEEARHLWAMVYLLQKYFGRDGREEAEDLLRRRSGNRDSPRLLSAFNEATPDWLAFFMFTFFIDLPTIQKRANLHFSLTLDLFGSEISSNAASAFNAGIKGRYLEDQIDDDHRLVGATYPVLRLKDGQVVEERVPALSALNMRLRDDYVADAASAVERWWNRAIARAGIEYAIHLPHVAFNRRIGEFAAIHADPDGNMLSAEEWQRRRDQFLPNTADNLFIESLMRP